MSLMRWEPFGGLSRLHEEIDRMFDEFLGRPLARRREMREEMRIPSVDLFETDGEIKLKAELPGVDKDKLEVEVTDEAISIRAQSRQEHEEKGANYLRRERSWGSFQRVITLPAEVKAKDAKATCKDGLLEITVPKTEEALRRHPVKVKVE